MILHGSCSFSFYGRLSSLKNDGWRLIEKSYWRRLVSQRQEYYWRIVFGFLCDICPLTTSIKMRTLRVWRRRINFITNKIIISLVWSWMMKSKKSLTFCHTDTVALEHHTWNPQSNFVPKLLNSTKNLIWEFLLVTIRCSLFGAWSYVRSSELRASSGWAAHNLRVSYVKYHTWNIHI